MIEVILRESIDKLGKSGEVVRVAPGYARNYLLPCGLAYPATPEHRRQVDVEQRAAQNRSTRERAAAEALKAQLEALSVRMPVNTGEHQKLFGSVTAEDIAHAITAQGVAVTKRQIVLPEPIHALGVYQVSVRLHPEVQADIKLWVEQAA